MLTGKTRMLKTKRELFMRQKSGYIFPVITYLFVNNMSRKHMILMFEHNRRFRGFDDSHSDEPFGFLLTSPSLIIRELSTNFEHTSGVTKRALT